MFVAICFQVSDFLKNLNDVPVVSGFRLLVSDYLKGHTTFVESGFRLLVSDHLKGHTTFVVSGFRLLVSDYLKGHTTFVASQAFRSFAVSHLLNDDTLTAGLSQFKVLS